MADDPISNPRGNSEIYFNGQPVFQPPQIVGNPNSGMSGAPPPAPTTATTTILYTVPIQPELDKLATLQERFAQVGLLFDQKGSSMNACQNLPPAIATRYLQECFPGETCWEFYKRMIGITQKFEPPNTSTLTTTGQLLAAQGNTIVSPLTSAPGVLTNYNQNPGGPTLLYMVFMGILI